MAHMVRFVLRTVLATLAGFVASFALVIGVEIFSNIVYPLPSDVSHDHEAICRHVANYPAWVLTLVVGAWGLTAAIGTWISQKLGNVYSSSVLGLFLLGGVGLNISMLPYPIWFKVVIMIVMPIAAISGCRLAVPPTTKKLESRPEA
jgi:ABC-type uncharacterized transport system permease subunit